MNDSELAKALKRVMALRAMLFEVSRELTEGKPIPEVCKQIDAELKAPEWALISG